MKRIFFLMLIFCASTIVAQNQKSHWTMSPNEVDFTSTPSSSSSLNSLTFSYTVGNSAYDEQGNLLFYVHNTQIYNATNTSVGSLSTYNSGSNVPKNIIYAGVEHEIAIVPFKDDCEKYYVIYLVPGSDQGIPGNNMHQALLYSIVSVSGGTVTVTSTTGTTATQLVDRFNPGNLGGIAVSPELEDGGRYLFCVAGTDVNRYYIDDSGISFEETILTLEEVELETTTFELTELELFWQNDGSFKGRLGWVSFIMFLLLVLRQLQLI